MYIGLFSKPVAVRARYYKYSLGFITAICLSLSVLNPTAHAGAHKKQPVVAQPQNRHTFQPEYHHVGPHTVRHPREVDAPRVDVRTGDATIDRCCTTIATGNYDGSYAIEKDSDLLDPYTTGSTAIRRGNHPVERGRDYIYDAPEMLGSDEQISKRMGYHVTLQNNEEQDHDYYNRRLSEVLSPVRGGDISDITTEVGQGSQSHVFMVHDLVPRDSVLKKEISMDRVSKRYPGVDPSYARRLLWASSNSKEVIKVRTPTPWGGALAEAGRQARRDIALTNAYEECAKRFKEVVDGTPRPLIEVVHYNNAHHELERGFFRQPTVNGDTAYKIAARIAEAKQGDKSAEHYLINEMGFKSVNQAEHKIRLLEAFYHETHFDIIRFEDTNTIPMMAGHVRGSSSILTVGFDYNLGQNVIWDPKDKIFKAIDF